MAFKTESSALRPGDIVRVRSRLHLVNGVTPGPTPGDHTLVSLSCIDDDAQGKETTVLWEAEVDAFKPEPARWGKLDERDFDAPNLFAAYLHTLRWNCVTATDPTLFQAPYRAGIEAMAYQLEPLRKALLLPRVNLFIADDVGLGKTIEAGLILRELLMRQKVRRVVVACPPSLVEQWKDELEQRFGLVFAVFDRTYVATKREERGLAINPWSTHSRFIISQALLRDEDYAQPLRSWLDEGSSGERPASLLILDEAHHAAPAAASRYAVDSDFTRAIRDLAPLFEHRLFLSATPHNGHSNSFSALLEILDPQRFCRGVPVQPQLRDEVLVRRLKSDLREIEPGFPKREIVPHVIDGLPPATPELRLFDLLAEYGELLDERLSKSSAKRLSAARLVFRSLQTRLLSSVEAFARTLAVHRRTLEKHAVAANTEAEAKTAQGTLFSKLNDAPGADDDRSEVSDADLTRDHETQIAGETRRIALADLTARERALLDEMTRLAEDARDRPDARVKNLAEWIRTTLLQTDRVHWNRGRVIIFTEWVNTKDYLRTQLEVLFRNTDRIDDRIGVIQGGPWAKTREAVKAAFNADPDENPLRILIATDAAREGVNLQNYCNHLFHFDLPWNPSRIEQRNGRIDRKLQREPVVFCHHFIHKQRVEDRILEALVRKTKTIAEELGSLTPVLHEQVTRLLDGPIIRRDIDDAVAKIDDAALDAEKERAVAELEDARRRTNVAKEIDHLRLLLKKSADHLELSETNFRDAMSSGLQLLGAEPLRPAPPGREPGPPRFAFPRLDQQEKLGPLWTETLDTLRPQRRAEQKPWDWRKESPPRPVVFEAPKYLDAAVVQLHLEHRVAKRLLQRFLAQGFVHDDLSRACVGQTKDAIPRVILLGRVSLYGASAARLHDEIIAVAARWLPPETRKGALAPYAETGEQRTLELLETALTNPSLHAVPPAMREKFRRTAAADISDLKKHFDSRAAGTVVVAKEKLRLRGEQEAQAMVKILEGQMQRIGRQMDELPFREEDLSEAQHDEWKQYQAERSFWEKRMELIPAEIKSEPARIRASYDVKATRTDFVGIAYLWPVSG